MFMRCVPFHINNHQLYSAVMLCSNIQITWYVVVLLLMVQLLWYIVQDNYN